MPWEKSYDEAEVLERAMTAFWAHGYEGTSIADLVAVTGINRASLYSSFQGKRSLFVAALKLYDRRHRSDFLYDLARQNDARETILAVFESAARPAEERGLPPGCLLVNTALELSPHDAEIGELVRSSLGEVEHFFAEMIDRARYEGSVPQTVDPAETARALLGLFMGLRVAARAGCEPATLSAITAQAEAMLR